MTDKKRRPVIIGVIGDVCAGKSTASKMMQDALGSDCARIWDADAAVRRIQARPEIIARIAERFGNEVLASDGTLNRQSLASVVFSDERELKALTAILREPVSADLTAAIESALADGVRWLILDAPTLYESGNIKHCDWVFYIAAAEDVKNARAKARGWSAGEIARREARLESASIKKERSDFVIENSGDAVSLRDDIVRRLKTVREDHCND